MGVLARMVKANLSLVLVNSSYTSISVSTKALLPQISNAVFHHMLMSDKLQRHTVCTIETLPSTPGVDQQESTATARSCHLIRWW
jgi:hypothetical protein